MMENPADLPQYLIINEILVSLPAESIGRYRCVSKPWRRSLSSPRFVKDHLKRHQDDPECILFTDSYHHSPNEAVTLRGGGGEDADVLKQVNFPFYGPGMWLEAGSCDGLVLFSLNKHRGMVLVNPITLEATEIPDNTRCFSERGLGYDSFEDDYKIVKMSNKNSDDLIKRVDVFSLKTKTWRRLANSPYYPCPEASTAMHVNGCIHWLASEHLDHELPSDHVIAAFNLASEEFEEVPFPVGLVDCPYRLTVLDGCLALEMHSTLIELYVMKEYGVQDSWFKIVIHIHDPSIGCWNPLPYEIICLLGEDEILINDWTCALLAVYNWRDQEWKDMVIAGIPPGFQFYGQVSSEADPGLREWCSNIKIF